MNNRFSFFKTSFLNKRFTLLSFVLLAFLLTAALVYWPKQPDSGVNSQSTLNNDLSVFYKSLSHNFIIHLPASWLNKYEVIKTTAGDKTDLAFYSLVKQDKQKFFSILIRPLKGWSKVDLTSDQFVLDWAKDRVFIWQSDQMNMELETIAQTFKLDDKILKPQSYNVYFGQKDNGSDFDCSAVSQVTRSVIESGTRLEEQALRQLFLGPSFKEQAAGYTSWFSAKTSDSLLSLSIKQGRAYVNLRDLRTVIPGASSSCGSAQFLSSIQKTLEQFPTISQVFYALEGSPANFYNWLQIGCDNDRCDTKLFNQ